jgi:hypothetical protein
MKQFINRPVASTAMNNWLGGSIGALYDTIGQAAPIIQRDRRVLPPERASFARGVIAALGGTPKIVFDKYGSAVDHDVVASVEQTQNLGRLSLHYVELLEVLGRPPTLDEFGARKLELASKVLQVAADTLWVRFAAAVEQSLRETGVTPTTR